MEFVQADALAWQSPEQAFDLIVTHFFLDCFPPDELMQIIANLARAAAPGAAWLLAAFFGHGHCGPEQIVHATRVTTCSFQAANGWRSAIRK